MSPMLVSVPMATWSTSNQLDHVVVVVQHALDALLRVVAEPVGHCGDADDPTLPGAGQQLLVPPQAAGLQAVAGQGVGAVVAEGDRSTPTPR